jgi:hypothetical protein
MPVVATATVGLAFFRRELTRSAADLLAKGVAP